MRIKFIYFDLGGVAFHFRGGLKKLARKYSIDYRNFDKIFKKYDDRVCKGEISAQELWDIYKKELNIPDEEIKDFAEYWVNNFEPIKETKQLIVACASKYKVGLLTNIYKGIFPKIKEKSLLPNVNWDAQIQSCDVGYVKPEKEIYKIATKKSKVYPEEILFIDDNKNFIESAKKIGWQTFLFNEENPKYSIIEIKKILNLD